MNDEIRYRYWLTNIAGFGKVTANKLLDEYGDARGIWGASENALEKSLPKKKMEALINSRERWNLIEEFDKLENKGIRFIPMCHPDFPDKLKEIPDSPFAIFVKGKLPDPDKPAVAIIGARMCSDYGRYMARELGLCLGQNDIQIISGLASGIDGISQQAALDAKGSTFGVLGCGVDICYPAQNKRIYDALESSTYDSGIISEYPPGTAPRKSLFPPRNRLISGLSDAVIVVEARKKSGTFITVDMALEQGKEVFAIPGRVTDRLSDGCNYLIKQGAGIVVSPRDIVENFYGIQEDDTNKARSRKEIKQGNLPPLEQMIMNLLDVNPISSSQIIDGVITQDSSLKASDIMSTLTILCIKGIVFQEGNYYRKIL